jgi:tetratricopeptide (TPR) repeat protein
MKLLEVFIIGLTITIGLGLSLFVMWTSLRNKASKYNFGGAFHAFIGRFERADIRYKTAMEYDPENFEALYYMAMRRAEERQFPQAALFYERCLKKRPDDPNILFKFGAVSYDMGHKDRAVELWKKFIEKSRNKQNLMMVSGLLEKIDLGEKEILSNPTWLEGFTWNEEGLGASKKMAILLTACAVEAVLLVSLFLIMR